VLTGFTIALGMWLVLVAVHVYNVMGSAANPLGDWVGQTVVTGVVGLAVMLAFLAVLLVVFSELGHADPAPEPWPPEE
jgi:hypothetical protein